MRSPIALPLAVLVAAAACSSPPPPGREADWSCKSLGAPQPPGASDRCTLGVERYPGRRVVRYFAVGNHLGSRARDGDGAYRTNPDGSFVYELPHTAADFCEVYDRVVREHIAPCLAQGSASVNVLVFPEDAGLAAAFVGTRGTPARAAAKSADAFVALLQSHDAAYNFVADRYPGLPIGRTLSLALTDLVHRAVSETFRGIARTTKAHVLYGGNLAPTRPAVASESVLGDPDAPAEWAGVAPDGSDVYNVQVLVSPSGDVARTFRKVYLVPSEEQLLALSRGPLDNLAPYPSDPAFGRVAAAISKDAWMRDVVDRLDAWGTEVVVQPEAFGGWTTEQFPGDWLPDVVKASAHANLQRYASFRYGVVPCLTGNLFDLAFDGQSHIVRAGHPGDPLRGFVGQPRDSGFGAIGPWAATETAADQARPLAERRAALAAVGRTLLPGGERANAYAEAVVALDLDLPDDGSRPAAPLGGSPGALGASRSIAAGFSTVVRNPDVAADGDRVAIAFQNGTLAGGVVLVTVSSDGGRTFADPIPVSGPGVARRPAVAVAGTTIAVAFEEQDAAAAGPAERAYLAVSRAGGPFASRPVSEEAAPALQWAPDVAIVGGEPVVAWVQAAPGSTAAHKVVVAGGPFAAPARVDPSNAVVDNVRGNQYAPRIAATAGGVEVAWLDFRDASWDVYAAPATAGAFAAAVRVNDTAREVTPPGSTTSVELERLHAAPAVAWSASGVAVAWSDLTNRRADGDIAVDVRTTGGFGADVRVDGAPAFADAAFPDLVDAGPGAWALTWQDRRSARGDVYYAVVRSGVPGPARRLDDAEFAMKYRPRIARAGTTAVVVWEDWRSGRGEVRAVRGPLSP